MCKREGIVRNPRIDARKVGVLSLSGPATDQQVAETATRTTCKESLISVLQRLLPSMLLSPSLPKVALYFSSSVSHLAGLQSFPSHRFLRFRHVLFWEFPFPAWAVASCSGSPQARGASKN